MPLKKVRFQSSYSNYPKSIVGESQYQDNISYVVGYFDIDEKKFRADGLTAELYLEDDNPFDPGNAVRVDVEKKTVGYLSKNDASKYRNAIAKLGLSDFIGVCGSAVSGKRDSLSEEMNFGVFLDLDLHNLRIETERPKEKPQPVAAVEPITKPRAQQDKVIEKKSATVKFGGKMPLIPIKGNGFFYWFVVFPFVAVIDLYIILFWGIWFAIKWLWDTANAARQS